MTYAEEYADQRDTDRLGYQDICDAFKAGQICALGKLNGLRAAVAVDRVRAVFGDKSGRILLEAHLSDEIMKEERERCVGKAREVLDKHVYMAAGQSRRAGISMLRIKTDVLVAIDPLKGDTDGQD